MQILRFNTMPVAPSSTAPTNRQQSANSSPSVTVPSKDTVHFGKKWDDNNASNERNRAERGRSRTREQGVIRTRLNAMPFGQVNPLQIEYTNQLNNAIARNDLPRFQQLLATATASPMGRNINWSNRANFSPYSTAIEYENHTPGSRTRFIQALVASPHFDFDQSNQAGTTPLHWTAYEGHQAVLQSLLSRRAEVNAVDLYGNTPLHLAASNGDAGTVRILLGAGADARLQNEDGSTAVDLAEDYPAIQALLRQPLNR